jgi:diguanylate cyclase (GGDEF)-like protein
VVSKFINWLFLALYSILGSRFVIQLVDPKAPGALSGDAAPMPIWNTVGSLHGQLDGLYRFTDLVMLPVKSVLTSQPTWACSWFPQCSGTQLAALIQKTTLSVAFLPWPAWWKEAAPAALLPGVLNWTPLVTLMLIVLLKPVVFWLFGLVKNWIWNLWIEMAFTQKKQKVYQEELQKRAQDLVKLNVDYKNLSKEASQLKNTVVTDDLTKVYNKRFFIECIKTEFQRAKTRRVPLALVMMDIDHFKKLNDTYGHIMGDVVLKAVAKCIKELTPKDCFTCRFGGEEFSCVMPAKSLQDAIDFAERVRLAVQALRFKEDPNLVVTVSQGVCRADFLKEDAQKLENFEAFVKLADDELYRSKLNGRNQTNSQEV